MNNSPKLSVNVNKIATLRNSRGKNLPDVLAVSLDLIKFGAQGITVHPRPDARHIRFEDVRVLKKNIEVELNVEGYPSEDFLELCLEVLPAQVTLVPDPPDALTSSAGFQALKQINLLEKSISQLKSRDLRVSVFVDNNLTEKEFGILKDTGCDRVELYTEDFANSYGSPRQNEVMTQYIGTAKWAMQKKLGVNAGHDLNLKNLKFFRSQIPSLLEVSIGHALICDSLYFGFENTIQKYLECLK